MAARTRRIALDQPWRDKIQTTKLIQRLTDHINGDVELSNTQVRGIEILLNKTLPNLQAINHDVGKTMETIIYDVLGRDHKN